MITCHDCVHSWLERAGIIPTACSSWDWVHARRSTLSSWLNGTAPPLPHPLQHVAAVGDGHLTGTLPCQTKYNCSYNKHQGAPQSQL